MSRRHKVAVDFDGTLVGDAYPGIGEFNPGAIEAVQYLSEFADIVVFTARIAPIEFYSGKTRSESEVLREIRLVRQKLDNGGLREVDIHTDPWKPAATVFVDDRAIEYKPRPKSWSNIVPKVLSRIGITDPALLYPEHLKGRK